MKKVFFILIAVAALSCKKEGEADTSTCTCRNSDYEVVGTYTGLSSSDCEEREVPTAGISCSLN